MKKNINKNFYTKLKRGVKSLMLTGAMILAGSAGILTSMSTMGCGSKVESKEEKKDDDAAADKSDAMVWSADCFLYTTTNKGENACAGFSEKGYEKLLKYKDAEEVVIVLPAKDVNGDEVKAFSYVNYPDIDTSVLTKANLKLVFPDSYTSYYASADKGAYFSRILKAVELGKGFTDISGSAFKGYANLESVVFPETLKTIGFEAFYECTSLKSVIIPQSCTFVGGSAFRDCIGLESVEIRGNLEFNEVGVWDMSQFNDCSNLKTVTFTDGVTCIGEYMFAHCTSLETVNIPESVLYILEGAFEDCESLKSISLPGVILIEPMAFSNCKSLESVDCGNKLEEIKRSAFSGCEKLVSVTLPETLCAIYDFVFTGCPEELTITAPADSYAAKYATDAEFQLVVK
ncbi:MAG: leucine-rich repeat domain-containing protein [Lachnospiraceae bacterium]|nr:leucine-rich repeat domain-containing protein [Lachnospiraceae bacterium]